MNTIRPTATHTSLTLRPLFLLDYLFALPRNTSRAYIPVLYVFNKIDAITIEELEILDQMPNYVPISSQHEWNLEELMEEIWNRCLG